MKTTTTKKSPAKSAKTKPAAKAVPTTDVTKRQTQRFQAAGKKAEAAGNFVRADQLYNFALRLEAGDTLLPMEARWARRIARKVEPKSAD